MRLINYIPLLGFIIVFLALCYSINLSYNSKDYVYKLSQLELTLNSDQKLDLKDLKGKFCLLHLVAPWCESCQNDYPLLNKIKENTEAVLISVTIGNKKPKSNPLYDYIAIDKDHIITRMIKIRNIPETIIINPEGVVVFHYTDILEKQEVEDNVIPNMKL